MKNRKKSYKISAAIYLICALMFGASGFVTEELFYRIVYYTLSIGCIVISFTQYTMSKRVD